MSSPNVLIEKLSQSRLDLIYLRVFVFNDSTILPKGFIRSVRDNQKSGHTLKHLLGRTAMANRS